MFRVFEVPTRPRVEWWSSFPTSNVYKPIILLAAVWSQVAKRGNLRAGWSGGAFPELDYIKTNNITWYSPQPPPNVPFIYDQCWKSAPPLHPARLPVAPWPSKYRACRTTSQPGVC